MDKIDVALVVHDTIINFSKKIPSPFVLFVDKNRFSKLLDLMKLQKHLDYTPSFVVSTKGGFVIYYCLEIIDSLVGKYYLGNKKKMFIEGITLHELLHIWNGVGDHTVGEAIYSEKLVASEMKSLYPEHYTLLKRFEI